MGRNGEVARSTLSSEDFFAQSVAQGEPALLDRLVGDWPAVHRWTPSYLAEFTAGMGDIEVAYRSTPADMPRLDLQRLQRGTMRLSEILQECARSPDDGPEIYVPGIDLPPATPLARDVDCPALLSRTAVFAMTVFFGRNTKCIGHYHAKTQALLCQVQGVKRVWMYPPSELGRLYLFPAWSDGFFRSQVNFYGDRSQFPHLDKARGRLYELHPGDALFIPLHWLHVPEGPGWNVSVTHWWRPRLRDWTCSAATVRSAIGITSELARRFVDTRRRSAGNPLGVSPEGAGALPRGQGERR